MDDVFKLTHKACIVCVTQCSEEYSAIRRSIHLLDELLEGKTVTVGKGRFITRRSLKATRSALQLIYDGEASAKDAFGIDRVVSERKKHRNHRLALAASKVPKTRKDYSSLEEVYEVLADTYAVEEGAIKKFYQSKCRKCQVHN